MALGSGFKIGEMVRLACLLSPLICIVAFARADLPEGAQLPDALFHAAQDDSASTLRVLSDRLARTTAQEHPESRARILSEMASLQRNMGRVEESARLIEEAMELYRELDDQAGRADCFRALGEIALIRTDHYSAELNLRAALRIDETLGRDHGAVADLIDLGTAFAQQGQDYRAETSYRNALERAERIGDSRERGRILLGLALLKTSHGNHEAAAELARTALEIFIDLGDTGRVARTATVLGTALSTMGEHDEALTHYRRSIEINRRLGNRWGEALDLVNIGGMVHLPRGEEAEAEYSLKRGLQLAEELDHLIARVLGHLWTGDLLYRQGDLEGALEEYGRLRGLVYETGHNVWMSLALYKEGLALEALDEALAARRRYADAADLIEARHADTGLRGHEIEIIGGLRDIYERWVGLLMDDGRASEAFEAVERGKGLSFPPPYQDKRFTSTDRELVDSLDSIEGRIEEISRKIDFWERVPDTLRPEGKIEKSRADLFDLMDRTGRLLSSLEKDGQRLTRQALRADQVRKELGAGEGILEFFVLEDRLCQFLLTADGLEALSIPIDRAAMEQKAKDLVRALRNGGDIEEIVETFRRAVIAPLEDTILSRKIETLHIVPDHFLIGFPIDLLGRGGVSLNAYFPTIVYDFSATILTWGRLRPSPQPAEPADPGPPRVLVAYNEFDSPRHIELERQEILRHHPDARLVEEKDRFLDEIAQADLIYILPHMDLMRPPTPASMHPFFSSILFKDGRLKVYEIFNHLSRAQLVFMNDCNSGFMDRFDWGEEMIGFPSAFMSAGAQSVIGTLWEIDGKSSAEFITRFLDHLNGSTASTALKHAKLDLIAAGHPPRDWAGYRIYGDWSRGDRGGRVSEERRNAAIDSEAGAGKPGESERRPGEKSPAYEPVVAGGPDPDELRPDRGTKPVEPAEETPADGKSAMNQEKVQEYPGEDPAKTPPSAREQDKSHSKTKKSHEGRNISMPGGGSPGPL